MTDRTGQMLTSLEVRRMHHPFFCNFLLLSPQAHTPKQMIVSHGIRCSWIAWNASFVCFKFLFFIGNTKNKVMITNRNMNFKRRLIVCIQKCEKKGSYGVYFMNSARASSVYGIKLVLSLSSGVVSFSMHVLPSPITNSSAHFYWHIKRLMEAVLMSRSSRGAILTN